VKTPKSLASQTYVGESPLVLAGFIIGIVALIFAIAELPYAERLKRPVLDIEPVPWQPRGALPSMTFASARVINKPLTGIAARYLSRDSAEACEITIDFYTWGDDASRKRVFPPITGRWDSHHQPLKFTPVVGPGTFPGPSPSLPSSYAGGTVPTTQISAVAYPLGGSSYPTGTTSMRVDYDPSLDSPQQDISVGSDRGQISAAILKNNNAFAFANESYGTPPANHLCKPEWKLTKGETYRVEIRVKGSNADYAKPFKLEYLSNDFAEFRLQEIRSKATGWRGVTARLRRSGRQRPEGGGVLPAGS
jgi:hypothetical protein